VHTLYLAEALHAAGQSIHVIALGDPATGFYRPTSVPHTIVPAPPDAPTLEERVFRSRNALAVALARLTTGKFDILHAQDCISARAAAHVRDLGAPVTVFRTVHHLDEFTTPSLIECQNLSVLEPDRLLVVSHYWREQLLSEYGRPAQVITNGVDTRRFSRHGNNKALALRARLGANGRHLFLTVGGIEPRKGSSELIYAFGMIRAKFEPGPVLAVIGGKSFQDYSQYRQDALLAAHRLGIELGRDLVLAETIPDDELSSWYFAADTFVFPSVKEGWGLALLEALAAGLPAITSDIAVFREYLENCRDVLMVPVHDAEALADAMVRLAHDSELRNRLRASGPRLAAKFTWEACADQHQSIYECAYRSAPSEWSPLTLGR
jgi:glycosyltransferase-like protein